MAAPCDRMKEMTQAPGRSNWVGEPLPKSGCPGNSHTMSRQQEKNENNSLRLLSNSRNKTFHKKISRVWGKMGGSGNEEEKEAEEAEVTGKARQGKSTRGRQSERTGQPEDKGRNIINKRGRRNGGRRTGNGGEPRGCVGRKPTGQRLKEIHTRMLQAFPSLRT